MGDEKLATKIGRKELGPELVEIELIEDGLTHQTYLLEAEESEYVLQISDKKDYQEKALERKVQAFALAEDTQLPVPHLVTRVETFEDRKYYIAEKLPSESLRESFDSGLVSEIGRKLAEIHRMQNFEKTGYLMPTENSFKVSPFDEGSWKDWILNQVSEDTEQLEENGMGKIANQIGRFFDSYGEKLPRDFQPVLCHNDYSPDNILAENGEITGILDFDYVYSGHNQRDLVKSANSFWIEGYNIRKELYNAYQEKENLEKFEKNEPLYRLETLTQIIASLFELKAELSNEEKDRYTEMLEETLQYAEEILGSPASI